MGKLKELMGNALEIANSTQFRVFIHYSLNDCEEKELTYMQLGLYLNAEHKNITSVHIYKEIE